MSLDFDAQLTKMRDKHVANKIRVFIEINSSLESSNSIICVSYWMRNFN